MLLQNLAAGLRPPPRLTPSEWADRFRRLSPEASAEPGTWDTSRAEYQRGIMDAFTDPLVETVVVKSSAQVGKTEAINNVLGYHIDLAPCPIMVIHPTIEMGKTWSKDRLDTMLRDTPRLRGRVSEAKSRDSDNTVRRKKFPGGHLTVAGANTPVSLAQRPVRIVIGDDVDRFPPSAGEEGDPVTLAGKRTTTFWNRKLGWFSTPTNKGTSRIDALYEGSDQRRFFVPCPDCGHHQHLRWAQVHWDKDQEGRHLPETAAYVCEQCGACWDDLARAVAVSRGEWRATAPFKGVAGFHLNELCSPWVRLEAIVAAFLVAKNKPDTLKVWTNTVLGESWEAEAESVKAGDIMERAENYGLEAPATVPAPVALLTAGVDVQDDRLEVEVVGWGAHEESWSIEHRILWGYPAGPELWEDLGELLAGSWLTADGRRLQLRASALDTGGHHTQAAYAFCRTRWHQRVWAIKGMAGEGRPVFPPRYSKQNKGRVPLFAVGVDAAKEVIYARLRGISKPGPGYCHFPTDRDREYFDQLTGEKAFTEHRKGFAHKVWIKTRERNEALDLRVYAYAALCGLYAMGMKLDREVARAQAPPPPRPLAKEQPSAVTPPSGGVSVYGGAPRAPAIVLNPDPYL